MPEGYDPTARPWYKSAIGKEFAISEPYEDANTKQFMMSTFLLIILSTIKMSSLKIVSRINIKIILLI